MASGRNNRFDGRSRSSPYCSMATVGVFVALCLVGVWMLTSTTVVPVEDTMPESNAEVKDQVSTENFGIKDPVQETNGIPFEDNPGDLPEDARNGFVDNQEDTSMGKTYKGAEGPKDVPYDANANDNGGETNQDGGVVSENSVNDAASQGDDQGKDTKQKPSGIVNKGQQRPTEIETIGGNGGITENDSSKTIDKEAGSTGTESGAQQPDKNEGGDGESAIFPNENSQSQIDENVVKEQSTRRKQSPGADGHDNLQQERGAAGVFANGAQSDLLNETNVQNTQWSTQASVSNKEKKAQESTFSKAAEVRWKLCNTSASADYIPCLDNEVAIKKLRSTKHYEHRERHCPETAPTCLVPLPNGYLRPIKWPDSRNKIWYKNVPHTELATVKGHQNWVKVSGDFLTFPGGGTQFIQGAPHYIDNIQKALPDIEWGKQSRVVLDVGCGVASFGGYIFDREVITMSLAPKDEHEAQVQFALERGIPAISAVMGTKRLPFPGMVFDVIHCARCRVPWHIEGGKLLLELNRLLRPGGYFVWSATPVYLPLEEDVEIWQAMSKLTEAMCWELVAKTSDDINKVGLAIYKKPLDNTCYDKRKEESPPLCPSSDDPNAAWNIPLQACMHRLPVDPAIRGWQWPAKWPERLMRTPYWLNSSQQGVYGKPAPNDFQADYEHWKHVVSNSYRNGMGIDWTNVRNVMDMRAIYGGFAAAMRDMEVWVMNVVAINSPDTLPIIYERGLFGIYHDWCESLSTYPRTYDLLHADHLFSKLMDRCGLLGVMAEVDRVLRPEGKLIVRDSLEAVTEVESIARSLHWEVRLTFSKGGEGLLCLQKTMWRPLEVADGGVPS